GLERPCFENDCRYSRRDIGLAAVMPVMAIMVAVPAAVVVVMVPVAEAIVIAVAQVIIVTIAEAVEVVVVAIDAGEGPAAGYPVAIGIVAVDPDVARSGARWGIVCRAARANVEAYLSCIGGCCRQTQSADCHCCCEHP